MTTQPEERADYRTVNSKGWDALSLLDDPQPVDPKDARIRLDPYDWLPWDSMRSVLCVAGGGGDQGPAFASLGYDVTVTDLSAGQLERDRQIARETDLRIECIQADMVDLSPLAGRTFDLVYQPTSSCYVPDIRAVYREIAGVTRPGGHYVVQHWSPTHLQVADDVAWDGSAYRLDRPASTDEPRLWLSEETWSGQRVSCLHFGHTLDELIGGLCDAGFDVVGFREPDVGDATAQPGSDEHLAAYLPAFMWVLARRRSD
jgi:SAM-dependent methyltransferase